MLSDPACAGLYFDKFEKHKSSFSTFRWRAQSQKVQNCHLDLQPQGIQEKNGNLIILADCCWPAYSEARYSTKALTLTLITLITNLPLTRSNTYEGLVLCVKQSAKRVHFEAKPDKTEGKQGPFMINQYQQAREN